MDRLLEQLKDYLTKLAPGGLCVAFSGGVDSSLLLKLACMAADDVHAVTACTPFHTAAEPREAGEAAAAYGAVHHLLTPQLPRAVMDNPPERCYLCKKALFEEILRYAGGQSLAHILDGTNADDLKEYRPGIQALKELGVHSPLAELGITKSQVRELAARLGLTVAEKPSAPCLATRFPYNQPINPFYFAGIDRIERQVRGLGIPVVRARVEGTALRLEVPLEDFAALLPHRKALVRAALDAGFAGVSLDLEGFRSGSMDIRAARLTHERSNPK